MIINLENELIDIAGATDDVVFILIRWWGLQVLSWWVDAGDCFRLAVNNRWCGAERVEAVYLLQKAILSLILL